MVRSGPSWSSTHDGSPTDCVNFPGGEQTTYTAAAVVLATHALTGTGPTAGLFRGESLPPGLDLSADAPVAEA